MHKSSINLTMLPLATVAHLRYDPCRDKRRGAEQEGRTMETLERIKLANARKATQAERIRMALAKAQLNDKEFERITNQDGYQKIGRNRIASPQKGTAAKVYDEELLTIAMICDVPLAFVTGEAVTLPGYEASLDNPGYLNSDILNRSRIDHQLGDCIGCLIDPDFHVTDDWQYRDPIPGQTEIVIDLTEDTFAVAS